MTELEKQQKGQHIAQVLRLSQDLISGMYLTSFGRKTAIGIFETVKTLLNKNEEGMLWNYKKIYINDNGKVVISCIYIEAKSYFGGTAEVFKANEVITIDTSGQEITWQRFKTMLYWLLRIDKIKITGGN